MRPGALFLRVSAAFNKGKAGGRIYEAGIVLALVEHVGYDEAVIFVVIEQGIGVDAAGVIAKLGKLL